MQPQIMFVVRCSITPLSRLYFSLPTYCQNEEQPIVGMTLLVTYTQWAEAWDCVPYVDFDTPMY